ncbi:uncharacterized protein LOC111115191 [Crassostrea virginica]
MDSQKSAQDVLRCNLCETPVPPLFCDLCHINLCRSCAGDHLLDESKEHKVGEFWHREIDTIMKNLQSEIDDVEFDQLSAFDKEEEKLTTKLNEISQVIEYIMHLSLDWKNSANCPHSLSSRYQVFFPGRINRDHLQEEFGSLSKPSMTKEERVYTMDQPSNKSFLEDPKVINSINTDYYQLYAVTCLTDEEIWTSGSDDIIKLYDSFKGILQKSVQTFSGNIPSDIAVTESGDLLYTDYNDRSVNIAKEDKIQQLVRLEEWRPQSVCHSSSGDMLVIMTSDDIKETKLVRFSGSKEKQTIQWDDRRQPIFSSGDQMYICENRNLDICVVDCGAHVVLAVNAEGKLRFRYTGHLSSTKGWFCPAGITTDSLGKILTSDSDNDCIHILDEDGTFLRYIDSCDLQGPQGLCMDSKDHVFVADSKSGTVKKIQYYK